MKRHSAGFFIGLVVTIIVGFAVVVVVSLALGRFRVWAIPLCIQATITGPNSATINLSAYPDSLTCHPDAPALQSQWVSYCPTALDIPPDGVITVIIKQSAAHRVCTTISSKKCREPWEASPCPTMNPSVRSTRMMLLTRLLFNRFLVKPIRSCQCPAPWGSGKRSYECNH